MSKNRDDQHHYIGNSWIKIDALEWPIFESYELISVSEYIERQDAKLQRSFHKGHPVFFELLQETLNDTTIIVPSGALSKKTNDFKPCNQNMNLFISFTHLYDIEQLKYASNEELLKWIGNYGLPFKNATKNRISIVGDESTQSDIDYIIGRCFYLEKSLEESFGKYAMFRENFNALAEEASILFIAYEALKDESINVSKLISTAITISNSGDDSNFLCDLQPIEWNERKNDVFNILLRSFQSRLNGYLNKISPLLLASPTKEIFNKLLPHQKNDNEIKRTEQSLVTFFPSWRVPDLWTLMIILFYEHILSGELLRKCPTCGNLFYAHDRRMNFCPPDPAYYGTRSPCENNQPKKREQRKKRAAATHTEKSQQ